MNLWAIPVLGVSLLLLSGCLGSSSYSVDDQGRLHYGSVHAKVVNRTLVSQNEGILQEKIYLDVGDGTLALMWWTPVGKPAGPALLFHPGAGVGKEAGRAYAEWMVPKGFSVMSIDQRGFGETTAPAFDGPADYARFQQRLEVTDHRRVYDVLAAMDFLSAQPQVQAGRIGLVGESLGGRVMIMAFTQLPSAQGLVVISSSGYGMRQDNDVESTRYLHSIDAENYAPVAPSKPIFVLHARQDPVIPYEMGQALYARFKQPTQFVDLPCSNHGYCKDMEPAFAQVVSKLFA